MSGEAQPAPVAALLGAALLLLGVAQIRAQDTDWPTITGGNDARRYAALDRIDASNFARLEPAWRWELPDNDLMANDPRFEDGSMKQRTHVTTPIKVGDRLYVVTGYGIAVAVDPATGATVWQHDPQSYGHGRPTNHGFTHKGPSLWRDPERPDAPGRLIYASTDAILRAVYADEGTPVRSFGNHGGVDLTEGLHRAVERRKYTVSSPTTICRNVAIVGSSISDGPLGPDDGPPGDVRGFDVRTGRQLWTFHTVPQEGEHGTDTWEDESWRIAGGANVWGLMSADEELGLAYLPTSTPTNDWYGGHRRGDNLYAESLVAVDCETGERRWHFQAIHHGLWDYDFAAPAVLGDLVVDGRTVKAAMLPGKQAFLYVFDRETGEPVWPIEERQVPQTGIPGERTSPTQPFPTRPPPFDRQGMQLADVIDFTTEIRAEAERILTSRQYGPIYTPPSERGTVAMPGFEGGASWPGGAFDPNTGKLYVPSFTAPILITLRRPDPNRSSFDFVARVSGFHGPFDLPISKPPYSRVTAYDMSRGDIAWQVPLGEGPRRHPKLADLGLPLLGSGVRGHALVTKTLLIVSSGHSRSFRAQEAKAEREWNEQPEEVTGGLAWTDPRSAARDDWRYTVPMLRAFDKATGELVAEVELPAHSDGSPITYLHGGAQYLVVSIGGRGEPFELIAYRLPG